MKVILLENVEGIGGAGEVVEVSDGHARNFLFPRGLAAQATEGRVKEAEQKKVKEAAAADMALGEAQRHVDALDGKTVLLKIPVGPDGKPFGAITAKDIAVEIERALGIALPKGVVHLKEPIRDIGERPLRLEFPHGLEAEMTVVIEPEASAPVDDASAADGTP